jgi:hypothetical protein
VGGERKKNQFDLQKYQNKKACFKSIIFNVVCGIIHLFASVYNLMKFNYSLCNYLKCKFDDLLVNMIIVFDFHILIYVKVM